jgi:hypothetical protein
MALAALADEAGLAALEAEHTSYLAWLVGRDAEQARALRDRLCTTLSGSTLEPAAMTRLEPMVARLRALALAGTPKTVSDRDVSSALDLIGKSAKLRFENLVKFKPDLAKDERVKAAIAQMEEPGRAAFLAILASV